jgi:hypothetical protein
MDYHFIGKEEMGEICPVYYKSLNYLKKSLDYKKIFL